MPVNLKQVLYRMMRQQPPAPITLGAIVKSTSTTLFQSLTSKRF